MTDGFDRLLPPNLSATVASLPRRVRGALHHDDRPLDELLALPGDDGRTVAGVLDDLVAGLAADDRGLELVMLHDLPTLPAPAPLPPDTDRLTELDEAATALANRVGAVTADDWTRVGRLEGGTPIDALGLVRDAARRAVGRLHQIEALVTEI